jgi:N-formylglutamate amidohydrolase
MTSDAYQLTMPRTRKTSLVFASPHSGNRYKWSFMSTSALDEHTIRTSEDAFVDRLFGAAPRFGAPLLMAVAPRAMVDLNRSSDELDPALIDGLRRTSSNPRVTSGLGVIPRVVANGRAIYSGKLTRQEADRRLDQIWRPYHARLQALLAQSHELFGEAVLIDCHSMPHEAIAALKHGSGGRPDVVLGDRFGAAAGAEIVARIEASFTAVGLKVARNAPFAGAFTAQHYGRPTRSQHVVQIEIDRSLYMDEHRIEPNENFDELQAKITQVIAEISQMGRGKLQLAAE